jgi:predicted Zn finger-like uncharacterized protein
MILTCPACATRYEADDAKFPPQGRQVRCAKCRHVWHQSAPASEAAPPPEPIIAAPAPVSGPESAARANGPMRPPAPTPPPQLAVPGVAWIGLAALVVLTGFSAVHYRQRIAAVWPLSAAVYSHLGLTVSTQSPRANK